MENSEQSLIPFFLQTSLSLFYLLHKSISKELFGEALTCRNKKQEARRKRKFNRKNGKVNLLILEMGAWKTFTLPPCWGGGGGGDDCSPPPCPKKILGIGILLRQMQGTNARKVNCSCVYSACILKPVLSGQKW